MWFWRLTRTTVCSFEAQESLCLCSGPKAGGKPASQFEGHQAEKPLSLSLSVPLRPSADGRGPPTPGGLLYSGGDLSLKYPEQRWPEYLAPWLSLSGA